MADNLSLATVAAGQNQKEVPINANDQQLSSALADYLGCDLSAGNYTLTSLNFRSYAGFATTGNTVARNFTLPAVKRAEFFIENGGTATVSVILGSTTLTVLAGQRAYFKADGTANGLFRANGATSGNNIEIAISISGKPLDSQNIILTVTEAFTLPVGLTGSQFYIDTNPTSTLTITIYKQTGGGGWVSKGTIAFSTSGVPTVTFTGAVSWAISDQIKLSFPTPQDATAADASLNFLATKG